MACVRCEISKLRSEKIYSFEHLGRTNKMRYAANKFLQSQVTTETVIFKLLRSPGINSASLCNPAGRYDNPTPTRFLAPIDSSKIPAQK